MGISSRKSLPAKTLPRFDLATTTTLLTVLVSKGFCVYVNVTTARHDFEVVEGIVQFVAVPVMDDFVRLEHPSEMFLDYVTVLKNTTAIDGDGAIPLHGDPVDELAVPLANASLAGARLRAIPLGGLLDAVVIAAHKALSDFSAHGFLLRQYTLQDAWRKG